MSLDPIDRARLVGMFRRHLEAETDFQRGYYLGCVMEYAAQNALPVEELPPLREEARRNSRQN